MLWSGGCLAANDGAGGLCVGARAGAGASACKKELSTAGLATNHATHPGYKTADWDFWEAFGPQSTLQSVLSAAVSH